MPKRVDCWTMERCLRFVLWMQGRRTFPAWHEVANHFGVCRATAFRWISIWCDAAGVARPACGDPMPRQSTPCAASRGAPARAAEVRP